MRALRAMTVLWVLGAAVPAGASTDVALLLDTTGTMGEAIDTLRSTFVAQARDLAGPGELRVSVTLFRDHGDAYVVKTQPLSADMDAAQRQLDDASPAGGGDVPEALVDGLDAVLDLQWSAERRLLIVVTDAPSHRDPSQALARARELGLEMTVVDTQQGPGHAMLQRLAAGAQYQRHLSFEGPQELRCGTGLLGFQAVLSPWVVTVTAALAACAVWLLLWWFRRQRRRRTAAVLRGAMAGASSPWLLALRDAQPRSFPDADPGEDWEM